MGRPLTPKVSDGDEILRITNKAHGFAPQEHMGGLFSETSKNESS